MRSVLRVLGLALALAAAGSAQAAAKRQRVVVLSIKPADEATKEAATTLTEILLTDLSKQTSLEVVGEPEIASMVGYERQKQLPTCTEGNCLAEISGALGCDFLMMGTLGRVGRQLRIDLKLADTRKATIIGREGALVDSVDDLVSAARSSLKAIIAAAPFKTEAGSAAQVAKEEPGRGPLPWVLMGTGAAAVIAGGAPMGVTVRSKASMTFDQANTRTTAGLITTCVGLAAIASGVVVFFVVKPKPAEPSAAVTFAPTPQGAAIVATGRF